MAPPYELNLSESARTRLAIRHAVEGAAIVSIISTIFGLIAAGRLALALSIGRTRFAIGQVIYFGVCAIAFFLPVLLYTIASVKLAGRKSWAETLGIVVATLHASAVVAVMFVAIYNA